MPCCLEREADGLLVLHEEPRATADAAGLPASVARQIAMVTSMSEQLAEGVERARELAIVKLKEVARVLLEAEDFEAMETIQRAIGELEGGLEPRDRNRVVAKVAGDGLHRAKTAAGSFLEAASDAADAAVAAARDGIAGAREAVADKTGELRRSSTAGVAAGVGVASQALSGFAENLDWSTLDPAKYLYAGTRGISRGMEEARLVWESIPEQLRALGPEELSQRLDAFDWSHKVAHGEGGGNEAGNGIFELASLNRSRGAERMTADEVLAAQQVLADQVFRSVLVETASQVFTGAVVGAAVACVVGCLEYGLEYQRGDIDRDEMLRRIGRSVAVSAGVGATVSGVMAVVALSFPALIPVAAPIMVPIAVMGFCAVGVKVVGLSREWYELLRRVETRELQGIIPAAVLPGPDAMGLG